MGDRAEKKVRLESPSGGSALLNQVIENSIMSQTTLQVNRQVQNIGLDDASHLPQAINLNLSRSHLYSDNFQELQRLVGK